jgi:hypothetical protein
MLRGALEGENKKNTKTVDALDDSTPGHISLEFPGRRVSPKLTFARLLTKFRFVP